MESPSEPRIQDPRFEGNGTMIKLCIEDDEGHQTLVPIIRDEITIGRQEGNTIRLTERNVSRHHAKLVRQNERLYVEEIEARYGTRKNGEKLQEREEFREGDVVVIGDYRLTIQAEVSAAPQPPEASAAPTPGFSAQPTQITRRPEDRPRAGSEGTEILPALPAKIVIVSSNFAGQEFPLGRKEMVIGRGEECDIIIDHRSVSNKHAKITREGMSTYQIVDLNSKNGVRINKEKYTHVALKRGDIIELGHVKFRFVEPGENYVFSPLLDEDDVPEANNTAGSMAPKIAIIITVLLAVVLAIFAASSMMGTTETPDNNSPVPLAKKDAGTPTKEAASATPTKSTSKIDQGIARAQTAFDEGDVKKAIATLESLNEFSEPDAKQKDKIQSLLARAKPERPLEDSFVTGKNNLQEKEYASAIVNFMKIPGHSVFSSLIKKHNLLKNAEAGLTTQVNEAHSAGKSDLAKELAQSWVDAAPNSDEAKALLDKVSKKPNSAPLAKNVRPAPRTKRIPKKTTSKKKVVQMSDEEAASKASQATSDMVSGNPAKAIKTCRAVLAAGKQLATCNRVVGMSYKQQNNAAKACKYFRKAYKYDKAARTLRELQRLDCP